MKSWTALAVAAAVLLAGTLSPKSSYAAGFDCMKAVSPTEKAICSSSDVSGLDSMLGVKYRAKIASSTEEVGKKLKERQVEWLKDRDAKCGAAIDCLRAMYLARLGELDEGGLSDAGEKPLTCEGALDKVEHRISVTVTIGRVEKFELFSEEPKRGHDCLFEAAREKSTAIPGTSTWDDMPDGSTLVTVFDDGRKQGMASVKYSGKIVEIHLEEPPVGNGYCGLNGMIAKTLILTKGQKRCTLKWN